jgi:hypothetical protein
MAGLQQNKAATREASDRIAFALYLLLLAGLTVHIYRTPMYDMDSVQYMGNAVLMEETDPVRVHDRVYSDLRRTLPKAAMERITGNAPGEPEDQSQSRHVRAVDPYRFAEFLPLFAIRPLYNQAIYVVSKTGIGLYRSAEVISAASYFSIGVLLFVWVGANVAPALRFLVSFLTMLTPPLVELGRHTTSDPLASLVALLGLYLVFRGYGEENGERHRLAAGLTLLLASIYFRTDFVVLAAPVLLVLWRRRKISFWQAGVLGGVAVASVLAINHFAGDYGIKMLYFRNFVGVPIAPAEVTPQFTVHDYLAAFAGGVRLTLDSFFVPFALLGAVGLGSRSGRILFGVTLAYVALHFVILPNWQDRWVAVFYIAAAVSAATLLERPRAEAAP